MDTLVFSRPTVVLRVLVEEVAECPKRAVYLAAAMVVEGLIYVLAVFDHVFRREYGVWPVIRSTKYAEVVLEREKTS
jgi:hypothetical protein